MNIKLKGFVLGMLFLISQGILVCCANGMPYKKAKSIVASGSGTTLMILLLAVGIIYG